MNLTPLPQSGGDGAGAGRLPDPADVSCLERLALQCKPEVSYQPTPPPQPGQVEDCPRLPSPFKTDTPGRPLLGRAGAVRRQLWRVGRVLPGSVCQREGRGSGSPGGTLGDFPVELKKLDRSWEGARVGSCF